MSDFFNELINSRRDGTAPPQLAQMQEGEPEPPELEVTYDDAAPSYYEDEHGDRAERLAAYASECQLCGAVVTSPDRHTAWHRTLGG